MRRILTALGVGVAMSGTANAEDGFYGKYETPRYDVVQQLGAAELRDYAPHILASVAVRGDQGDALSSGFRALAGYIFGGNDVGASVSMTSPVAQTRAADAWTVTFMMPTDFTLNTLPTPTNAAVRFSEVPAQRMLVLTFSGRARGSALDERSAQISQIAADAGLQTSGTPVFMFYDGPMTLPFMRRNEVALAVQ
jgi:hypothetical protein